MATAATLARSDRANIMVDARELAFEFGMDLSNHLPMVLWALNRLGGTVEDAERFTAKYKRENSVGPVRPSPGPIEPDSWTDHLGERAYEAAYREFFASELERLGEGRLLETYLPSLAPGIAASALHAFMRLAYAFDARSPDETARALAYWASTYLRLGEGIGSAVHDAEPLEVLQRIAEEPAFRAIEPERDLLWEFMRSMAQKPEFRPVQDWLRVDDDTVAKMAHASLRLYAAAMDFSSLHAVTGTHWLRLVIARARVPEPLIRGYWQAIAALYPKIGFVAPLGDEQAAELTARPCPDWPEIKAAACAASDEHDISLAFSAYEEWRHYGDPLYKVVAARRVGLID